MKRLWLTGLVLMASLTGAQCIRFAGVAQKVGRNYNLQAVPGASIKACTTGGTPCPAATIYSNSTCTMAITNSTVTADANGNYSFYAFSAKLTLQFSGPGISTYNVPDVRLTPTAGEIAASIGAVSSVGLSVPGVIFTSPVAGSPVTSSGTLALALKTQLANQVFAGPATGGAVTPTFRALALADLPAGITANLPQDPTACLANNWVIDIAADGTLTCARPAFSNLTGTATIAQSGTGVTTAPDDNTLIGNGTTFVLTPLLDCPDVSGQHINYNATSNSYSCGTSSGGGLTPHALLSATHSDTAPASPTLGDTIAVNTTPAWAGVPGNTSTTRKFYRQTGTGTVSALPAWDTLVAGDIPSLDASKITSGTVATARLGSGTANTTSFLRGDQTWSGPGPGTPTIIIGTCNATATASATLTMRHFGSTASTCNSTQINRGTVMPSGGTLQNLTVVSDVGVNASDGVFTVFVCTGAQQPACTSATGSTLTCTIGTANKCTDFTHTVSISQGDMLIVKFTTQAATTIGNVTAALEKTTP